MSCLAKRFMTLFLFIPTYVMAAPPDFKQLRVPMSGEISDIAIADLNKDGRGDIVTIDHENKKIQIFMSDSKLKFRRQYVKEFPYVGEIIVGIADFTGDGKVDVAIDSIYYKTHFAIFPGKGNGRLRKPKLVNINKSYAFNFTHAVVRDFNDDGKPDIAGLSGREPFYSIVAFINQGKGKFKMVVIKKEDYDSIAAGDFDADGDQDLVVGDLYTDDLTFFKNKGDGRFAEGRITPVGNTGSHLHAGYLNGDSHLDIMGSGNSAFDGGWSMLGQGNGKFIKKESLPKWHWLGDGFVLADFMGDKKLDIAEPHLGGIWLHRGLSTGKFFTPIEEIGDDLYFGHNASLRSSANVAAGDINSDGKTDFAGAHWDGYNNRKPVMTDLVIFINGGKPVTLSISNLSVSTLNYIIGVITLSGSFSFQSSAGDLQYKGGSVVTDNAFLEFEVELDFPYPQKDYTFAFRTTGSYLNRPGQKNGIVNFNLVLPTTAISTNTPKLTLSNFSLWDYNLVHSNELLKD